MHNVLHIVKESDKDYSMTPPITERPRKSYILNKPINFEFGSNNKYTINSATPNPNNNKQRKQIRQRK